MSFFDKLFGRNQPAREVPHPIEDTVYGRLVWDAADGAWRGSYACPHIGEFTLIVPPGSADEPAPSAELKAFFQRVEPEFPDAKKRVVDVFLREYAPEWTGGEELSAEQCARQLSPREIIVWDHGSIEISFASADEEDLLSGHELVLEFDSDGSSEVKLEG